MKTHTITRVFMVISGIIAAISAALLLVSLAQVLDGSDIFFLSNTQLAGSDYSGDIAAVTQDHNLAGLRLITLLIAEVLSLATGVLGLLFAKTPKRAPLCVGSVVLSALAWAAGYISHYMLSGRLEMYHIYSDGAEFIPVVTALLLAAYTLTALVNRRELQKAAKLSF